MYPRLSDLINDIFGTNMVLPVKTFGLFFAAAFVVAFIVLRREFIRREAAGQFRLREDRILTEGPVPFSDVIIQALIWGLVAFKLGYIFVDYEYFSSHTEDVLLSGKGFWLTGLLGLGIAGGLRYRDYVAHKDVKPKYETIQAGPSHYMGVIVTIAFVAGVLGSKVFAILETWDSFIKQPMDHILSLGGMSFLGGLLTAGYFVMRYVTKKGFNFWVTLDSAAPALILAYAVGRIGCQMAGDGDWGIDNPDPMPAWLSFLPEWAWSFDYPHNVANEGVPIPGCTGDFCRVLPTPVFPTPLYETTMGLIIFGILMGIRKKMKYAGQLLGIYMILIGLERFLIERIRINDPYNLFGLEFTQAQLIATLLMIAGAVILVLMSRRKLSLLESERQAARSGSAAS